MRHVEVRAGRYHDSVVLMQTSRALSTVDGVGSALVAMATPLNVELLTDMGFAAPAATPADLVVAVEAATPESLENALRVLAASLTAPAGGAGPAGPAEPAPRTVGAALRHQAADLVFVSVPGPSALPEAMDALHAGSNVMIFSDNVSVEQEVTLKREADRRGLLVLGPDCGTAILGGVALGFANVVRRGRVGIVAASGTGAQQICCLLDAAGVGISHLVGVGGRDLSSPVAGRSTLRAIRLLDADPSTDHIVVVSKPAAPEVAAAVAALSSTVDTPVHLAVLGPGQPDLTAVVTELLGELGLPVPRWPTRAAAGPTGATDRTPPAGARGRLAGLFAGGTLADEALLVAAATLGPIGSNLTVPGARREPVDGLLALDVDGSIVIDFGDDAMTIGRAHPMIDPTLRLRSLRRCAEDGRTAVVLLDVVLGHGADPDPAATLAPAIRALGLPVVVSLCGTGGDPQDWDRQADAFAAAGAEVHLSNAAAARAAVALVEAARAAVALVEAARAEPSGSAAAFIHPGPAAPEARP